MCKQYHQILLEVRILLLSDSEHSSVGPAELETLPKDLVDLISYHNQEFEGELVVWDQAQQRPTQLPLSAQPITARKEDGTREAVIPNTPSAKDWTEPAASAELGPAVEMEEVHFYTP